MSQPIYQQLDPKAIEALKAARDQVMQADKGRNEDENVHRGQDSNPKEAPNQTSVAASVGTGQAQFGARNEFAPLETHNKELNGQQLSKNIADKFLTGFAEEFVQKLASIKQEEAAVDEEMTKVEKLWSSLVERKKQLEARRDELTKVRDKLKELDKEMSDVLKSK